MRQFAVKLWVKAGDDDGHSGMFAAPNALNAIGQACLHFGVATHAIVEIAVREQPVSDTSTTSGT